MATHKILRVLTILACITAAAAAVGQQPSPVGLNLGMVTGTVLSVPCSQSIPSSRGLKTPSDSHDYSICIDPNGFGDTFAHLDR